MKTLISMLFFLVVSSRALASCDSMDGATCKQESDSATLLQVQAKTHVNEESQEEYQEQNEEDDEEGKEDGREKANQTQPGFPGSPGYKCVEDYNGKGGYGPNANDCCPKKCLYSCGQEACMKGSPFWQGPECCPPTAPSSWPECGNGQMAPCKIMSKAPAAPPAGRGSCVYDYGGTQVPGQPYGPNANDCCPRKCRMCGQYACMQGSPFWQGPECCPTEFWPECGNGQMAPCKLAGKIMSKAPAPAPAPTTTATSTSASAGSEYSVMKTSSEYCGGTSLSAGASTGEEECKGRCSEEPKCKFMSLWKTGGLNYCLLTETCDSFIPQSWHEIVIFEKPL